MSAALWRIHFFFFTNELKIQWKTSDIRRVSCTPVFLCLRLCTSSPFSLPCLSLILLSVLGSSLNGGWRGSKEGRGSIKRIGGEKKNLYITRVTANCTCGWRKCLQAWVIRSSAVGHNQARSPGCLCIQYRVCVCALKWFSLASGLLNRYFCTHQVY